MQDKTQEEKKYQRASLGIYNFIMGFVLGLFAGVSIVLICAFLDKLICVDLYVNPWAIIASGALSGLILGLFIDLAFGIGFSLTLGPFLAMHYDAIPLQERLTFSFFMICGIAGAVCLAELIKSFFKTKQNKAS
ncbi:hypothetical protein KKD84_00035 [Patescibacteria group bacterium]|nr:hypothetical protein [Patescibacteria group bacterium]